VLCKHEVVGSIPSGSTRRLDCRRRALGSSRSLDKPNSHHVLKSGMRAVCHREEETYPIVYRAEVWLSAFVWRIELRSVREDELPVVSICLTAMFSDMFEANGLSIAPAYGASHMTSAEGWVLIMRAIKCLKGIRWMPWR
jgi:hypothetical protein